MRNKWCATSTIIALILIYLHICCLFETSSCATLNFGQIKRRTKRLQIDKPNQKDVSQMLKLFKNENSDYETEPITYDKRRIDLGLARGFSGAQAAKHLLGLSAANMATGPGRRRRRTISNSKLLDLF